MSIQIKNLSYIYNPGTAFEKKALDNINLTIPDGTFIGVIGHTGCGKSTLIQHLNSLIKPTSGQIIIDGEDINEDKTKLKSIRQKIGLVFQYPEHQLFETTLYRDVAFGPQNMGLNAGEIRERVHESLKIVGISEDYYEKSPFELSGGQKRRAAIAGVLAMRPKILILDEPTAGLDPRGRSKILENIKNMHKTLKITIILVSHNMEDISAYSEYVVVMDNGKIIMQGTCAEIFSNSDELEKVGLAAPQISYVMNRLRQRGFDIRGGIYTVDAAAEVLAGILRGRKSNPLNNRTN